MAPFFAPAVTCLWFWHVNDDFKSGTVIYAPHPAFRIGYSM